MPNLCEMAVRSSIGFGGVRKEGGLLDDEVIAGSNGSNAD